MQEALLRSLISSVSYKPFRNDPYARKQRRRRRGLINSIRGQFKRMVRERVENAVDAQQEIERYLRKNGYSWRQLELTINRLNDGKWSKIEEAMVGFGYTPRPATSTQKEVTANG